MKTHDPDYLTKQQLNCTLCHKTFDYCFLDKHLKSRFHIEKSVGITGDINQYLSKVHKPAESEIAFTAALAADALDSRLADGETYICTICGKQRSRQNYKIHMKYHALKTHAAPKTHTPPRVSDAAVAGAAIDYSAFSDGDFDEDELDDNHQEELDAPGLFDQDELNAGEPRKRQKAGMRKLTAQTYRKKIGTKTIKSPRRK